MKTLTSWIILSTCVALGGCGALNAINPGNGADDPKLGNMDADPNNQPRDITLHSPAPVLVVTLEITADAARVVSARQTPGAPALSIVKGRPLLISALDAEGRTVHAVSLDNPLEIHTTGAKKPETAKREKATVTVAFSKPDRIRSLQVEIRDGPGRGLKQRVAVKAGRDNQ